MAPEARKPMVYGHCLGMEMGMVMVIGDGDGNGDGHSDSDSEGYVDGDSQF
jgi:hypothetical protein